MRSVATAFVRLPPKKLNNSQELGGKQPSCEGFDVGSALTTDGWPVTRRLVPIPKAAQKGQQRRASREGAAEPASRAAQHTVNNSETLRFCCRQVATTLNIRSTIRNEKAILALKNLGMLGIHAVTS